jgi:PH domain
MLLAVENSFCGVFTASNGAMLGWLQRRRERGHIDLSKVCVVETAQLAGDGEPTPPVGFAFQVGYSEGTQNYTLHLLAVREQERSDWIRAIRAGK